MSRIYDCIVAGIGGFGSAAVYHLARNGHRVLGLDRFPIAHDRGSSHGETRVIRKAYFEHPDYVPLLLRAYELWSELEATSGRSLYRETGLLLSGPGDGAVIPGARLSAARHELPLLALTDPAGDSRLSGFGFPANFETVFEPEAGFLYVEDCVRTHLERAVAIGAVLSTNEPMLSFHADGTTVTVTTERNTYHAANLIVAAGAWTATLLESLQLPIRILRKHMFWHSVRSDAYNVERGTPAYLFELPDGVFYGFPSLDGESLKVAEHSGGMVIDDPGSLDRVASPQDINPVKSFVRTVLPDVEPHPHRHCCCMYSMTPDGHFIVDHHPDWPNVLIAAGFSGHGFKFTSVIGEALADMAAATTPCVPLDFLKINRPALAYRLA